MPSNRKGHRVQVVRYGYPLIWLNIGVRRPRQERRALYLSLREAKSLAGDLRKDGEEVRILDPDNKVIAHWAPKRKAR